MIRIWAGFGYLFPMELTGVTVDDFVDRALAEDLGETGDLTAQLCIETPRACRARIVARAEGVLAGLDLAAAAFRARDAGAEIEARRRDGDRAVPGHYDSPNSCSKKHQHN